MPKDDCQWKIRIAWCSGEGAEEIEQLSANTCLLSDGEFRQIYRGIFQTIDGVFTLHTSGSQVAQLKAVDSTYWEIEGPEEFESHMLNKYGAFKTPG
jgi:hypothetical protein